MNEKSIWRRIGSMVGANEAPPSTIRQLDTQTRKCPAGHPMAGDWTDCPYCKAEQNAQRSTKMEEPSRPAESAAAGGSNGTGQPPGRRSTRVFDPNDGKQAPGSQPGSERVTRVFQDPDEKRSHEPTPSGNRPLTGIVVTFTWSRLGQMFPLYAGRNYGGTATSTREGERMEILLTEDSTMSSTHFLILHQAGKYRISDCHSTNGTFVNGVQIDPVGVELEDDARIVAGNTLLVFKKIAPPAEGEAKAKAS